jgi:hypothetical protein
VVVLVLVEAQPVSGTTALAATGGAVVVMLDVHPISDIGVLASPWAAAAGPGAWPARLCRANGPTCRGG